MQSSKRQWLGASEDSVLEQPLGVPPSSLWDMGDQISASDATPMRHFPASTECS